VFVLFALVSVVDFAVSGLFGCEFGFRTFVFAFRFVFRVAFFGFRAVVRVAFSATRFGSFASLVAVVIERLFVVQVVIVE
jgi:hypothetical protein